MGEILTINFARESGCARYEEDDGDSEPDQMRCDAE